MIQASIIVPTLNRASGLDRAIQSFAMQDFPSSRFEIIIVDNGSTDGTETVAHRAATGHRNHNLRTLFEPEPGLLSGRHRGALEARGEVLIFVDDDVEATRGWLSAIMRAFGDETVHMVGGPSLAKFERDPPRWLRAYWKNTDDTVNCSPLSILSLGGATREIDPIYVWGLNFSIRRKTLCELGGFHPDCIPRHLQMYQGDGETGLSFKAREQGLRALYVPEAKVFHNIPKERLTFDYFEERYFYQGVCDSYTEIRGKGNLDRLKRPEYRQIDTHAASMPSGPPEIIEAQWRTYNAYVDGYLYHQDCVRKSGALLQWVLKKDYFDYRLPALEKGFEPPARRRFRPESPAAIQAGSRAGQAGDPMRLLSEAADMAESGKHEAALFKLNEAIRSFPRAPGLHLSRAFCLTALNRHEEAILACREELSLYPGSRKASELMDRCLRCLSRQPAQSCKSKTAEPSSVSPVNGPIIQQQLAEFQGSSKQQRQSHYERAKEPLKNLHYFEALKDRLIGTGVKVQTVNVDILDFERWLSSFRDLVDHYRHLKDVFIEKCFEHYITHGLLQLKTNDRYIDIAASGSPWAHMLNRRSIESYRLDLSYPKGIHGINIGADAAKSDLPSHSFSALSLQCSFECFMGSADTGFVKEASRILAANGRYAIAPLYIEDTYFISSSPYCDQSQVVIDPGAVKVWRDDEYKVPFCRMYSPESFAARVYSAVPPDMHATVIHVGNLAELMKRYAGQRIYCFFILYCEKA